MNRYLDDELIRIEGACHVVWDAYAQCECRTYPERRAEDRAMANTLRLQALKALYRRFEVSSPSCFGALA